MDQPETITGPDGVCRCWWAGAKADYFHYHDTEWCHPATTDVRVYEHLCLAGFQSGLSWLTILRRRQTFRAAFDGFDFRRVARYTEADVERLLGDAGIIRHKKKIESAINNARRTVELLEEHPTMLAYVWSFEPPYSERPKSVTRAALGEMAQTPSSVRLAADLKRRGFTFVGPTTAYAFMQSIGLVNDHVEGCDIRARATDARVEFLRSNR